jgi:competence protein ComEA
MDPSAAPWRVLESAAAPAVDGDGAPGRLDPPARGFLVSPVTAAAAVGAIVLVVTAFLLASTGATEGVLQVEGATSLAPIRGEAGSAIPGQADVSSGGNPNLVVVEIAGAVRRPGVFRLPTGSRIGDLIDAAGGYGPRLDAERASRDLNLAARLSDGDRVTVPSRDDVIPTAPGTGGDGTPAGHGAPDVVDLNRATSAELEALPGIGPATAGKIISSREEQAFTAVDDLRTRKLVGAKTFEALKDLVSVP